MRLIGLMLACCLCFVQAASATSSSCALRISGVVQDASAKTVLPGATLVLVPLNRVIVASVEGRFSFDSLCAGEYRLLVFMQGFDSLLRTVTLEAQSREIRLSMYPVTRKLREAEVVAQRLERVATVATDSLSREVMELSKGGVLTDYLKKMAGVSSIQTGPSIMKPVIHGMHSQRVVIMNAGIRQEGQQWGSEHAPEIDPFIADRLTVVKGASSIRYGSDAVGGVILVEPRKLPHEPGLQAELNLVGMSNGRQGIASGLVEQHLGKFFDVCWRLQGTVKHAGNLSTPDLILENTAFREYNWSGSLGIERRHWGFELFYSRFSTRLGIFTGSHIGNLSDLQRIIDSGETITDDRFSYSIGRPRQEVQHHLFSGKSWKSFDGVGKLQIQYGYQYNHRLEYDRDRPRNDSLAALNRPELELKLYTQTVDMHLETFNVKGFTAVIGFAGLAQDNQYGGERFFVPNYRLLSASGYGMLRWRRDRWELEAGMRSEQRVQRVYRNVGGIVVENDYRFTNPGYSGGVIYRPDSLQTWLLNAGTVVRAPSINEWFSNGLHHGTATYERGDSALGPEKAINTVATYRLQTGRIFLECSAYYMFIRDYIYLVPDSAPVLTISGAYPAFRYRHVDAGFNGVDFTLDWDLTQRIGFRSRNSVVFANNRSDGKYLELVPAPRFEQSLTYKFKDTRVWKDISCSVNVLTVSRQWRYEPGTDYIPPPPAYTLTGIDLSAVWIPAGQVLRMSLSVQNLFNVRYRDYLNRFRYFTDESGRNITLRVSVPLQFRTAPHTHEH